MSILFYVKTKKSVYIKAWKHSRDGKKINLSPFALQFSWNREISLYLLDSFYEECETLSSSVLTNYGFYLELWRADPSMVSTLSSSVLTNYGFYLE